MQSLKPSPGDAATVQKQGLGTTHNVNVSCSSSSSSSRQHCRSSKQPDSDLITLMRKKPKEDFQCFNLKNRACTRPAVVFLFQKQKASSWRHRYMIMLCFDVSCAWQCMSQPRAAVIREQRLGRQNEPTRLRVHEREGMS